MRKFIAMTCLLSASLFLFAACTTSSETAQSEPEQTYDWQNDWAVAEGFALEVDSEGFDLPSAIAFVPNPGDDPQDPLYYVTELLGQVKVVTNDRSVYTFAEDFLNFDPGAEMPALAAQSGLAGICLEPENGYVFITSVYHDDNQVLRNNIFRFQAEPGKFSLESTDYVEFKDVFYDYPTGPAHQVGPCQIEGDHMFVSVGDGFSSPLSSQDLETLNGKILRMTLDGDPVMDNPFYVDDGETTSEDYIWSYGHRNPFSLRLVDERLVTFENGPKTDRFFEVEEGINYLWDGSERSISTNAIAVFNPSVGPVQMDFNDDPTVFPEEYQEKFFVALSGEDVGIMILDYDFDTRKMRTVSDHVLRYRKTGLSQWVIGLAMGPDGLYFSPLMPNANGETVILKMVYDPEDAHPHILTGTATGKELFWAKGCLGCHKRGNSPGGAIGPPLDAEDMVERLDQRLNNDAYEASLTQINSLQTEPHVNYRAARDEVLAAEGIERVETWVKYRLMEPRFDNQYSQMPNLDLTEYEAEAITEYILQGQSNDPISRIKRFASNYLQREMVPILVGAFVIGALSILVLFAFVYLIQTYRKKRRNRQSVS